MSSTFPEWRSSWGASRGRRNLPNPQYAGGKRDLARNKVAESAESRNSGRNRPRTSEQAVDRDRPNPIRTALTPSFRAGLRRGLELLRAHLLDRPVEHEDIPARARYVLAVSQDLRR